MSARRILLLSFVILAISPKVVETAYNGYLVAFLLLLWGAHAHGRLARQRQPLSSSVMLLWVVLMPIALFQTFAHANAMRDVIRDLGALFAFYVGFTSVPRMLACSGQDWRLEAMREVSCAGLFVVLITVVGAIFAFLAGADAYFWRGEYVPFAHSWLPYVFAVNLGLVRMDPALRSLYIQRALLCAIGTLASLSRTDLVLMVLVLAVQGCVHFREIMSDRRVRRLVFMTLSVFLIALPFMLRLSVVQERIDVGVDEDDPSLAWRFIENLAFLDQYLSADTFTQIFGFGLGGRLSLPAGILDFDGNDSIPHLHNSYFTIGMKFGIVGLLVLSIAVYRLVKAWWRDKAHRGDGAMLAARWILLFVLGKAVTLQGLSEWSHVFIFGFACALIHKANWRPMPVQADRPASTAQSPALVVEDHRPVA